MKNLKKNLPFIITMSLFVIACAVVTLYTIEHEPQYVRITTPEITITDDIAVGDSKININTATAEELQALSGIGETIAERIITYRETHGGFLHIEEIMEVSGIGEKMFDNIKDSIYIN